MSARQTFEVTVEAPFEPASYTLRVRAYYEPEDRSVGIIGGWLFEQAFVLSVDFDPDEIRPSYMAGARFTREEFGRQFGLRELETVEAEAESEALARYEAGRLASAARA